MPSYADDRLIVALDAPTINDARHLVDSLSGLVSIYKLGMWLLFQPGIDSLVEDLTAAGHDLFLDYKLHDIGETVRHGTASIVQRGARFLTVHAEPQVMQAAVAGAAGSSLQILAVTVLTSLDAAALQAAGYAMDVPTLVQRRAGLAAEAGCAGVIASASDDLAAVRAALGPDRLIVTPGIRMPGDAAGDQRRTATPAQALQRGADYLVVGRPITQAASPRDAALRVVADMSVARVG